MRMRSTKPSSPRGGFSGLAGLKRSIRPVSGKAPVSKPMPKLGGGLGSVTPGNPRFNPKKLKKIQTDTFNKMQTQKSAISPAQRQEMQKRVAAAKKAMMGTKAPKGVASAKPTMVKSKGPGGLTRLTRRGTK